MATRIVVLGWNGQALEIPSATDAAAFVDAGVLRVSLTKWGGPLADATVLQFNVAYLRTQGGEDEKGYRKAWRNMLAMPMHPKPREFKLDVPIPVGG